MWFVGCNRCVMRLHEPRATFETWRRPSRTRRTRWKSHRLVFTPESTDPTSSCVVTLYNTSQYTWLLNSRTTRECGEYTACVLITAVMHITCAAYRGCWCLIVSRLHGTDGLPACKWTTWLKTERKWFACCLQSGGRGARDRALRRCAHAEAEWRRARTERPTRQPHGARERNQHQDQQSLHRQGQVYDAPNPLSVDAEAPRLPVIELAPTHEHCPPFVRVIHTNLNCKAPIRYRRFCGWNILYFCIMLFIASRHSIILF